MHTSHQPQATTATLGLLWQHRGRAPYESAQQPQQPGQVTISIVGPSSGSSRNPQFVLTGWLNIEIRVQSSLPLPVRGVLAPSYLAALQKAAKQPSAASAGVAFSARIVSA